MARNEKTAEAAAFDANKFLASYVIEYGNTSIRFAELSDAEKPFVLAYGIDYGFGQAGADVYADFASVAGVKRTGEPFTGKGLLSVAEVEKLAKAQGIPFTGDRVDFANQLFAKREMERFDRIKKGQLVYGRRGPRRDPIAVFLFEAAVIAKAGDKGLKALAANDEAYSKLFDSWTAANGAAIEAERTRREKVAKESAIGDEFADVLAGLAKAS